MARKKIDWELMEADWIAGIKTVKQLSNEHGVSRAAILKHWAKEGIERDLTHKIKAKAESLVTREVTREVTPERKLRDKQIIQANADNIAGIDLSHRRDLKRSRELVNSLLDELGSQIANKELLDDFGEIMRSDDQSGTDKRNEIYSKIVSFGGRTDSMHKLANTLRILVELERKVVKLDEISPEGQGNVNLIIRPI